MKKNFIIFSVITIFALPVIAGESIMTQAIKSWIGESIDKAIDCMGFPDSEKTIAQRRIFLWRKFETARKGINGYKVKYYCQIILETDENKTIINGQWKGDNCPFAYIVAKQLFNPDNDERRLKKEAKKAVKAEKQEE